MAPEIIPPVTRISTHTKSSESRTSKGQKVIQEVESRSEIATEVIVTSCRSQSLGWTGGEFVPSEQLLPLTKSDASGKPKRYSSQRQKPSAESALSESSGLPDGALQLPTAVRAPQSAGGGFTNSLPPRPLPAAAFYVSTSLPSGHIRLFNGPRLHGGPVAMATAATSSIIHAPYISAPGMLPGPFIGPSVVNYGPALAPPYPLAAGPISLQFAPGAANPIRNPRPEGNPLEVRGGTVYFNPEIQQHVDCHHGVVYFNPEWQTASNRSPARRAKAAIPIVKPEDVSAKELNLEKSKQSEAQESHEEHSEAQESHKEHSEAQESHEEHGEAQESHKEHGKAQESHEEHGEAQESHEEHSEAQESHEEHSTSETKQEESGLGNNDTLETSLKDIIKSEDNEVPPETSEQPEKSTDGEGNAPSSPPVENNSGEATK